MIGRREKSQAAYIRFLRDKRMHGFGMIASRLSMDEDKVEELYEYAVRWNIRAEDRPKP